MERGRNNLLLALFILGASVFCNSIPVLEQEYKIEAFQKPGNSETLILKIQPISKRDTSGNRRGRQDEEEEDPTSSGSGSNSGSDSVQSSTPYFIPAVIPALTKIFTGIITGNLNEIVHGSSSFAPQNISHAIDTVYNQVVGLPAPISTPPTSQRPLFSAIFQQATSEPSTRSPPTPAAPEPETSRPSASSAILPGQPLNGQSLIITTTKPASTSKPISNEDDEDDSDVDGFGFRRLRRKDDGHRRL